MVVGVAQARWTTAGMKLEDGMQGSRFEAVDERGRSLEMEGGIGVLAPAWWRRTAVDGVADSGGRTRVGWRGCIQGVLVSNARKFTNLAPVSNFYYITTTLVGWG